MNTENIFKDTYVFEFLDLPKNYSEKNLRKALVSNLKGFILELGKGFSFVGEEYRLEVGNHDYYIDLLFFRVMKIKLPEYSTLNGNPKFIVVNLKFNNNK